jgi:hypothetical protein
MNAMSKVLLVLGAVSLVATAVPSGSAYAQRPPPAGKQQPPPAPAGGTAQGGGSTEDICKRILCVPETTIVGRVQKPFALAEVSRIAPKLTLAELRQPFLDRIEEAVVHDPF